MRYSEVVKALDENPARVFEATLNRSSKSVRVSVDRGVSKCFRFEIFNGSKMIERMYTHVEFKGFASPHLDWHEEIGGN